MRELRTVSAKGQVTIPESIRSELGIETGDRLIFTYDGEDTVTVMKDKTTLRRTAGLLDKHLRKGSKGVTVDEMHKAIAEKAAKAFRG